MPEFDILTAGFPCQAFSIAGKRMGFDDTRGSVFFEIARIAKEKRPSILFLENVRGLLNHDQGRTFFTIINTLYEMGYDVEWQVINGKYFLPQKRERVFIIGYVREKSGKKIFPITEESKTCDKQDQGEKRSASEIVNCIESTYYKGLNSHGDRTVVYSAPIKFLDRHQANYEAEIAQTVYTANSTGILDKSRLRVLTPLECERLQGFPDNWTEGISDTQRYKCLGNAVMVPVIEYIAKGFI